MEENEEKFDKKKDFIEVNSPICKIDGVKSLLVISEIMQKVNMEILAKIKTSLDNNIFMTFYNCIRNSNFHLMSFYKSINSYDLKMRKLFFIRNEMFENFIIQNNKIDYLNFYASAVGCISNELTQKIISSGNVDIIKSYVITICSIFSKSEDINLEEVFNYFRSFISKNKYNLEVINIIYNLSVISNIRDDEYEELLMKSENHDAIFKYAEFFKLYRGEVVNACLNDCNSSKSADRLNNYIRNILDRISDFKNDQDIENFLIKNYNYNSHTTALCNYLSLLLKNTSNNPFVECVEAVAKAGNMSNLEKILKIYKDYYKNVKVPRLEDEVEKLYLKSCSGEGFFHYIKSYGIANDFINETIVNRLFSYPDQIYNYVIENNINNENLNNSLINSTLCLKFATAKNIRVPSRENFIFNYQTLNIGFANVVERANAMVKYIEIVYNTEKSVECLKQYENDLILYVNRNPDQFIKIALKYISYLGKRFVRYENFLSKIMFNGFFGFERSINEYMAYCDNAKTKGVKKINEILFSPTFNIGNSQKDLLLKYVLDYAKAPCELFDKSKIGDDPRYLQFKEDYEREKLARVKRQRRKPSGINPQEQGESGQGQQAPVGEDTNV